MSDRAEQSIIYQISLRAFTPQGTLSSAAQLLPYLKELGTDFVYLCPMFCEDDSEDRATWSPRQIASGTNNPKNPYKIKDYFHVDEEYGTDADLKAFITRAHALGLKVMLDLVYLHCSANAVFIREHPDYVKQEANGQITVGDRWPFARINYENPEARAYLTSNMRMFVEEYGVDGFRCDVGDEVPLSFWEESVNALRETHPQLVMFNEGWQVSHTDSVFDLCYARFDPKALFAAKTPAKTLTEQIAYAEKYHFKVVNMLENHDIASDTYPKRAEVVLGTAACDSYHALMFTLPGGVMLWNGNEMADMLEQCMFSNRFYGKRIGIDWANLQKETGKQRHDLIQALCALRHAYPFLKDGAISVLQDTPVSVLHFTRTDGETVLQIYVNCADCAAECSVPPQTQPIFLHRATMDTSLQFAPYGVAVLR